VAIGETITVLIAAVGARQVGFRAVPSERFVNALNDQIGREFNAAHQYTALAAYYDRQTFPRLAKFFFATPAPIYASVRSRRRRRTSPTTSSRSSSPSRPRRR
jgi:hypothetical protein